MRSGFAVVLVLAVAISTQWSIKAGFWDYYYPEAPVNNLSDMVFQSVPAQLRSFAASILWLTADEYMHIGPSRRVRQNFMAGSYAANTELMPLLELGIMLDPQHIDAYGILASNLALYLGKHTEAIRLVQKGILANRQNPRLHELYSIAAYCYAFVESYGQGGRGNLVKNNREVALKYIDAAISSYLQFADRIDHDATTAFAKLRNYYVLRARFLADMGNRQEALKTWEKVQKLGSELTHSYLGEYFRRVQAGLSVPDSVDGLANFIMTEHYRSLSPLGPASPFEIIAPFSETRIAPLSETRFADSSGQQSQDLHHHDDCDDSDCNQDHHHADECGDSGCEHEHHSKSTAPLDPGRHLLQAVFLGFVGAFMVIFTRNTPGR